MGSLSLPHPKSQSHTALRSAPGGAGSFSLTQQKMLGPGFAFRVLWVFFGEIKFGVRFLMETMLL